MRCPVYPSPQTAPYTGQTGQNRPCLSQTGHFPQNMTVPTPPAPCPSVGITNPAPSGLQSHRPRRLPLPTTLPSVFPPSGPFVHPLQSAFDLSQTTVHPMSLPCHPLLDQTSPFRFLPSATYS